MTAGHGPTFDVGRSVPICDRPHALSSWRRSRPIRCRDRRKAVPEGDPRGCPPGRSHATNETNETPFVSEGNVTDLEPKTPTKMIAKESLGDLPILSSNMSLVPLRTCCRHAILECILPYTSRTFLRLFPYTCQHCGTSTGSSFPTPRENSCKLYGFLLLNGVALDQRFVLPVLMLVLLLDRRLLGACWCWIGVFLRRAGASAGAGAGPWHDMMSSPQWEAMHTTKKHMQHCVRHHRGGHRPCPDRCHPWQDEQCPWHRSLTTKDES